MNSVNLVGWVLHTCGKNALWNLVCYPMLPLTLQHPSSLYLHSTLSSFPVFPSPTPSVSLHLSCRSLSHTFFSSSPAQAFRAWNETGSVSAGGLPVVLKSAQLPPTISSLPSSTIYTVHWNVNSHLRFRMQHSWDPLPSTEETLHTSTWLHSIYDEIYCWMLHAVFAEQCESC